MTGTDILNSVARALGTGALRRPETQPAGKTQLMDNRLIAIFVLTGIAAAAIVCQPARGENADISLRRASERTSFRNDEIADGFFKIAFGAELQFGRRVERIRKFDEPVRVFVANQGAPNRRAEIAAVIADIRARVDHLDLEMTDDHRAANFIVTLVPKRNLNRTIQSLFGRDKAKK